MNNFLNEGLQRVLDDESGQMLPEIFGLLIGLTILVAPIVLIVFLLIKIF